MNAIAEKIILDEKIAHYSLPKENDAISTFLPESTRDKEIRSKLIDAGALDAWVRERVGMGRIAYVVSQKTLDWSEDPLRLVYLNRLHRKENGAINTVLLQELSIPDVQEPTEISKHIMAPATGWLGIEATPLPQKISSTALAILDGGPTKIPRPGINKLSDLLMDAAQRVPDRGITLLSRNDKTVFMTYASLDAEARRIAGGLQAAGFEPGLPILCIYQDNEDAATLPAIWGAIYAGLCPVPLLAAHNYLIEEAQARRLLDTAELLAEAPILTGKTRQDVQKILPHRTVMTLEDLPKASGFKDVSRDSDNIAAFFLTSGSTAKPKVVPQTHNAILTLCSGCAVINDLDAEDISLNWLPMDHVGSFIMLHMRDVYLGAQQLRATSSDVLRDPLIWLKWMSDYQVTNGWAPNFAFELVINELKHTPGEKLNLSSLRFLHNGGEAVVSETAAAFIQKLSTFGLAPKVVRPAWGMSETSSGCIFNTDFDPRNNPTGPIAVGRPCPGLKLRITDPAHPTRILPVGQIGALQVCGPMVLTKYNNNPIKTQESFAEPGWFDTGDLGRIQNGMLYLTGRQQDVIIVNGLNLSPAEIEISLGRIKGIKTSSTAVLSFTPSKGESEKIGVFFSPEQNDNVQEITQKIRQNLASEFGLAPDMIFSIPSQDIPKTSIGKIQKEKLRSWIIEGKISALWQKPRNEQNLRPSLWVKNWVKMPASLVLGTKM